MTFDQQLLNDCLAFVDSYWGRIIHEPEKSRGHRHIIPLPHTYIAPNDLSHWGPALFYWDTFFMIRGLIDTKREWLVPDVVDNFVYLLEQYGIIPNYNSLAMLNRSQPPFFSSMVFDAYYMMRRNAATDRPSTEIYLNKWLKKRMDVVKSEYENVWMNSKQYNHLVDEFGLNRYGDRDVGYAHTSEIESGWDFTTRFYNRANNFLPVDLNSYLYKYEKDFAKAAHILGSTEDEKKWDERRNVRRDLMNKYMWNEEKGFFFDYDYVNKKQSEFYTLAGFVPLWAKLASPEQAAKARENLPMFESEYGLTITAKDSMPKQDFDLDGIPEAFQTSIRELMAPKQWDYPHIWAPLEYLTVIGLLRYGYVEDAKRIMTKSVNANLNIFKKYGALLEKIDAKTGEKAADFHYPSQLGFGWTNAIFYRYVKILEYIEEKNGDIYMEGKDKAPYSLTGILH